MQMVKDWFQHALSSPSELQTRILTTLLVTLILLWIRRAILKLAFRRIDDIRIQYHWRKASGYVCSLIGLIVVGRIWFEGIQSLSTILGLIGAGLAIAFQDPLVNLAGWAFILWRRPFEVGDRIQIGQHRGDVIDLRIFMFTLMEIGNWVDAEQSTGRVIHIPNGRVFRDMVANYSRGFQYIWNEIPVLVTFESDWRKAKNILLRIVGKNTEHLSEEAEKQVRRAAEKYMIFFSKLTPTVYTSVRDSGVLLTIRYLCPPRHRRGSEQIIWEDILDAFNAEDNIDLAYPTQRFYLPSGSPPLPPQPVTAPAPPPPATK